MLHLLKESFGVQFVVCVGRRALPLCSRGCFARARARARLRYQSEVVYPRTSSQGLGAGFHGSGLRLGVDTTGGLGDAVAVVAYTRGPRGELLPPEEKGDISVGDRLLSVNGRAAASLSLARCLCRTLRRALHNETPATRHVRMHTSSLLLAKEHVQRRCWREDASCSSSQLHYVC